MAAKRGGADQDFQTIAILGFAADAGLLSASRMAAVKTGLGRLADRAPVVNGVTMGFTSDAVGILGVALGTAAIGDPEATRRVAAWAARFFKSSYERDRAEDWARCLLAAADRRIGHPLGLPIPISVDTADVRVALLSVGLFDDGDPRDVTLTLALARRDSHSHHNCERAALRLRALEWVACSRLSASEGPRSFATSPGTDHDGIAESDPPLGAQEQQRPGKRPRRNKPTRRNAKYEAIYRALREISDAAPESHEEVFGFLNDRHVPIPNAEPFKAAGGWLQGFRQNPHEARAWLSKAWRRLGLPAFARGPKK
jgi:hypothetical protein